MLFSASSLVHLNNLFTVQELGSAALDWNHEAMSVRISMYQGSYQ